MNLVSDDNALVVSDDGKSFMDYHYANKVKSHLVGIDHHRKEKNYCADCGDQLNSWEKAKSNDVNLSLPVCVNCAYKAKRELELELDRELRNRV